MPSSRSISDQSELMGHGPTLPRHQIPLILSQRYQRAAGLLKSLNKSADATLDVTEDVSTAKSSAMPPAGPSNTVTLPDARRRLPPLSTQRGNKTDSATVADRDPSNRDGSLHGGVGGPGMGGGGVQGNGADSPVPDHPSNTRRKTQGEASLPPATPYKPFPLTATSSFSPTSIPNKKLSRLAPQTIAKYQAYAAPVPEVAQMIERSGQRSKARARNERKLIREHYERARRKWGNMDEREMEGEEMARRARERMRNKLHDAITFREMELQFLVEGQRNSIDAIRLKEYLALRPRKTVDMPKGIYSDEDRVRVDRLLAS
ncbi:hypothetical protein DFS34DRAFT_349807 [Phlyctochytrium arcticum]|nr:hypothetical protein DFS34DRAFT_349807 [Phlyctochytrium arcticum]